jgi:hypothetical protein
MRIAGNFHAASRVALAAPHRRSSWNIRMAIRSCPACAHALSLESRSCPACLRAVAFDPMHDRFLAFDPDQGTWLSDGEAHGDLVPCRNASVAACNWLTPAQEIEDRCLSCRLNRTIPDLTVPGVLDRWQRIEDAKRRMLHGALKLGLPITNDGTSQRLVFDFLYDAAAESGGAPQFLTGHASGVITLNVIEADDAARERMRVALGEPYRTLLGHFRHEVAHYYWDRLVRFTPDLQPFRALFGNEQQDYGSALQQHYRQGAPAQWEERYISAYATSHPWEDFAETFAHYLHIVDTLATIHEARLGQADEAGSVAPLDPYTTDFAELGAAWIVMAAQLNEISRSMGHRDLYPFSLSPGVMLKLDFVHRLIAFNAGRWVPGSNEGAELQAMIAALRPI